jgi:hypothetical protein
MRAKQVNEFQQGLDPYKTAGLGISNSDRFIEFVQKKMDWNSAEIEYNGNGIFDYSGLAGSSIIPELREVIQEFGWSKFMKVVRSSYLDDYEFHYYSFVVKSPKSKNMKKIRLTD